VFLFLCFLLERDGFRISSIIGGQILVGNPLASNRVNETVKPCCCVKQRKKLFGLYDSEYMGVTGDERRIENEEVERRHNRPVG
jgi:hypothetical protein